LITCSIDHDLNDVIFSKQRFQLNLKTDQDSAYQSVHTDVTRVSSGSDIDLIGASSIENKNDLDDTGCGVQTAAEGGRRCVIGAG
jgi:hypothetical protein